MKFTWKLWLPVILLFSACGGGSSNEKNAKTKLMVATTGKVLDAIEKNDEKAFRQLMAADLKDVGEDEKSFARKFQLARGYYMQYTNGRRPDIIVKDSLTVFGKRVVFIPVYNSRGMKGSLREIRLMLGFGPEKYYPLNKMSAFEVHVFHHSTNNVPLPEEDFPGI